MHDSLTMVKVSAVALEPGSCMLASSTESGTVAPARLMSTRQGIMVESRSDTQLKTVQQKGTKAPGTRALLT